jgi:hypothetical protein
MRKCFLICAFAIAACAVMAPTAEAMKDVPITSGIVINNCTGRLVFGLGAYGCTICSDSGSICHDYSCNTNPYNGARMGCYAVTFIVKRGQPSTQATQMSVWAPGGLVGTSRDKSKS